MNLVEAQAMVESAGMLLTVDGGDDAWERVWIRRRKPGRGNRATWGFPKARMEPGEEIRAAARRGVLQAAGLQVERFLTSVPWKTFKGTRNLTRYFLGVARGKPHAVLWKARDLSTKVELVTWGEAAMRFEEDSNLRDADVLARALECPELLSRRPKPEASEVEAK